MDDVIFLALAGSVVEYVDDRYGRAPAWIAAITMIVLPFAVIAGAVWWYVR